MTHGTHFKLALTGFLLLYLAAVGSLVAISMPILDPIQKPLLWCVMLLAGILGGAIIVFEKTRAPQDA